MFDYSYSRPDFYLAKGLSVKDRLGNLFQALDLAVEVSVRMRCFWWLSEPMQLQL